MSPAESANYIEMFLNENCLDEHQDTELKRIITNFIKEFKMFKLHIKEMQQ